MLVIKKEVNIELLKLPCDAPGGRGSGRAPAAFGDRISQHGPEGLERSSPVGLPAAGALAFCPGPSAGVRGPQPRQAGPRRCRWERVSTITLNLGICGQSPSAGMFHVRLFPEAGFSVCFGKWEGR